MTKVRWGPAVLPHLRGELVRGNISASARIGAMVAEARSAGQDADQIMRKHGVDPRVSDRARVAADRLAHADMIWVAREMSAVALDASLDIPTVDPNSAPWRAGLMVFERPLPPLETSTPLTLADRTEWAGPVPVDAVSWHYHQDKLYVTRYCRRATLVIESGELQEVSGLQIPRWETLDLAAAEASIVRQQRRPGHEIKLMAFLSAAWSLMLTPTVAERRSMDPQTGGVTRMDGDPVTDPRKVTIIDLRPLRHVNLDQEPGESGRVYRHRWVVRGHWRQQAHGHNRELRRTTWVASYTKGPQDAPLLASEKVMAWRR